MFYRNKKKVTFYNILKIYFIPIEDYHCLLWWTDIDYQMFKTSSINEINELMSRHYSMEYKKAVQLLYQPGQYNICYNENNFL